MDHNLFNWLPNEGLSGCFQSFSYTHCFYEHPYTRISVRLKSGVGESKQSYIDSANLLLREGAMIYTLILHESDNKDSIFDSNVLSYLLIFFNLTFQKWNYDLHCHL